MSQPNGDGPLDDVAGEAADAAITVAAAPPPAAPVPPPAPRAEAAALVALAAPCFAALLAEVGMSLTTVVLALGRFPDPALVGGAAVAISLFNALAAAPTLGAASAQSTLAAAAFGAGDFAEVGVLAQRGLCVSVAFAAAVLPLLVYPRPLLVTALGGGSGDDDGAAGIVAVAAVYLRWSAAAVFPVVAYDALRRHLLAGGVAAPMVSSSAAALATNAAAHTGLVVWASAASPPPPLTTIARASAAALTASHAVNAGVLLAIVVRRRLLPRCWSGWRPATAVAAAPLRAYLRLAAPGAAQECAEWWALEVTNLVAARFGPVVLAAHVVLANLAFLAYLAPHAVGTGAATRVGGALGGRRAAAARGAALVALAAGGGVAAAQAAAIVASVPLWSAAYSRNAEVVAVVRAVSPALGAYVAADGCTAVLSGVLRGSGRQVLGAGGAVLLFWVVGLPAGATAATVAARAGWGSVATLWGLWGGMIGGSVLLVGGVGWAVIATDWALQVRRCTERAGGYEELP